MQTKVILIGKNPCIILGQTRDLGSNGFEVHLIKTNEKYSFEVKSKYLKSAVKLSSIKESISEYLIHRFGDQNNKNIILPADDTGTIIIDRNISKLSKYFVFPNVDDSDGKIEKSMDKYLQKQLAIESGFKVAAGWKIDVVEDEYVIPDNILYPCFVKPCCFDENRKAIMIKCENRHELENKLAGLKNKQPMLAEEYINIDKEWGILGVSTKEGLIIAGITEKHVVDKGVTAVGISHYVNPSDSLYNNVSSFVSSLGYYGFFGLDLLESKGNMYFCEVNFRLPNFGVSYLEHGFHLTPILVKSLLGEKYSFNIPVFETFTFADERVLLRKYKRNDISLFKGLRHLCQVNNRILKDKADKGPYEFFFKDAIKTIIKINSSKFRKLAKLR